MSTSSYKQSRWTGGRNWFFFYPDASSILHAENEKTMYNEERLIELSMVSLEFAARITALLWRLSWYNNQEIDNLFGLGYSSISWRVTIYEIKDI